MKIREFMAKNEVEVYITYKGTEECTLPYCENLNFDVWNCEVYSNVEGQHFDIKYVKTTDIRRKNKPVEPTQEEVFTTVLRNNIDFRHGKSDSETSKDDSYIDHFLKNMFKEDATTVIYDEALYD